MQETAKRQTITKTWGGRRTEVEVGKTWRRRYVAVALGGFMLRAESLQKAISAAKRYAGGTGTIADVVSVGVYETRALDGQPTGVYTENFCPMLDEADFDLSRNLRVVA